MSSWNVLRWLRGASPQAPSRRRPRRYPGTKPTLELLEARLAPAVFTVTDNSDSAADTGSLRYALTHLDAGAAAATNTITFAPTLSGSQTITETSADGGGLTIGQGVTITGPAAGVTIDGAHQFVVFTVASGVTASLSGLTISHGSGTFGGGIFNNGGTLTVGDSTFSGNSASDGGGILNDGTLTVGDSTFSGNSAGLGGGIFNSGTLTVGDSTFSANSASNNGGGVFNFVVVNGGTLTVGDSTFSGNSAGFEGGGIDNSGGTLTVGDSTFSANSAGTFGGGIANNDTLTLNGAIVVGNTGSGGAADDLNGSPIQSTSSDNVVGADLTGSLPAGQGNQVNITVAQAALAPLGSYGGPTETFALLPGSVAIGMGQAAPETGPLATDQRGFDRPTSGRSDAGAFQSGPLVVNTVIDGPGPVGPGLLSLRDAVNLADANTTTTAEPITFDPTVFATPQTITLNSGTLTFSGTTALTSITGPAAGVTIDGANAVIVFTVNRGVTASLSGLTISHGSATYGGGIYNQGTLTVGDSTFSANSATNGGGGIFNNYGTVTVGDSTFSANSASGSGGGIYNYGGTLMVGDSTFSANSATSGGGIFNGGTLTVGDSTFSANSATNGGGIFNGYTLTLNGAIVVGNTGSGGAADDLNGSPIQSTSSDNVVGADLTGSLHAGQGNQVNVSVAQVALAPLGYYGGPTQTFALLPGSFAIGMGQAAPETSPLATDQRGFARPTSGRSDAGAFQSGPLVVNTTIDSPGAVGLGLLSLRDAVNLADANTTTTAETITFDPTVFAAPQTITLTAGTLTLSGTTALTSITGPSAGVTIDGANAYTVFAVNGGVTASLTGLTISHGSGALGGGVFNLGTLTVGDSTFSDNSADYGGGILNGGTLTVGDSTFSDNSASNNGGGIANGGTLTVGDSTFSANSATDGGGGILNSGTLTLNGAIVVGNSGGGGAADDLNGSPIQSKSSDNVIGADGTHSLPSGQGNQVNVTPAQAALAPLGYYGGPTPTFALLPGSVALGKGVTSPSATTDQRGAGRPVNAPGDAGAFQDQGYTLTPTNTPQSAAVNTAFAQPLLVTLTENFAHAPLPGAVIVFSAPGGGASATLSHPAVTDANGQTSVTATANGAGGPYAVTAADAGTDTATFDLTNTSTYAVAVFAGHGTYRYGDATGWVQLSAADAATVAVDADGDVVASFALGSSGVTAGAVGVWRFEDATNWQHLSLSAATAVGIVSPGYLVAAFPTSLGAAGEGVWRFENGSWDHLNVQDSHSTTVSVPAAIQGVDASIVGVDAAGNVVGEFEGAGVWRFQSSLNAWQLLSGSDASLLQLTANGILTAEFPGGGSYEITPTAPSWTPVAAQDASALSVNPSNVFAAVFQNPPDGTGVYRFTTPIANFSSLQPLPGVDGNAAAVAIAADNDIFANFGSAGLWRLDAATDVWAQTFPTGLAQAVVNSFSAA